MDDLRINSLAISFPFPTSQANAAAVFPLTRSVSPVRPSCRAAASARARFDSVGWMKISVGFDFDRGLPVREEAVPGRDEETETGRDIEKGSTPSGDCGGDGDGDRE